MRRVLARISPVLRVTRVTAAFAAVSNTWFVVLWTRQAAGEHPGPLRDASLWVLLLGATGSAVGLFAFGACLNDVLDVRRDRQFKPDRPLASGTLAMEAAAWIVAMTLIVAVLGATPFGVSGVVLTLMVATAILAFNGAGKFVPGIGIVLLGLIYAGQMLVPHPDMVFLIPVWLVMTHTLIVAGLAHAAARKVPRITPRALLAAVAGWAFWSLVLLGLGWWRSATPHGTGARSVWPAWLDIGAALWPAGLWVLFLVLMLRKMRTIGNGPRASDKVWRYGSLWLPLYGCGWMIGAGHHGAAIILGALALAGVLGMTVLRELYGLLEQPVGFRV